MEEIDIIIATHNHLEVTIQCLSALYRYTETPFRLTVLDDSTDLTPEYFKSFCKEHSNVQFIHSDEWVNCINKKWNAGLKNTERDLVVMMGNSIYVEPYWLQSALLLMESDPKIGIAGFKLLNTWGTIQHAGIGFNNGVPFNIGFGDPGHRRSYVREVRALCPAALFRRSALPARLDTETYIGFVGFDDIDMCLEIRKRGWKIMYCGVGSAYHPVAIARFAGLDPAGQAKFWQNYFANKKRFLDKWRDSLNAETGWVEQ